MSGIIIVKLIISLACPPPFQILLAEFLLINEEINMQLNFKCSAIQPNDNNLILILSTVN